jgi:serine/threonine protein kinase
MTDMVRLLERRRYLTSWQGRKLLKGDMDGYFLGGYRLLYKIASGSFGRVYRGDDPRTGQVVAIKVLRNKWMMDKQKVDLFLREGKLGMTIRHPNIVPVLTVSQDTVTQQYFIVMDFIEGYNLRDMIHVRRKLQPDEAIRIIMECTEGLAYAHAKGLTHRDIKPTNILIEAATGQTKLVDFGLAEISAGSAVYLQRQDEIDQVVAVDRTVDYAGLEKATNQKPGDVRSDIYFLGTVLYECVAGATLMPPTRDRQARMQARRYQDVEETLAKNGPALGVPQPLMPVLAKMVAFEPKARYQTPTQLLEALQGCQAEVYAAAQAAQAVQASARTPTGPLVLFAVETKENMKDAFREKFGARGFRVLMSSDPAQAIKQYREKPYHALIVDAAAVGREAVSVYNRVLKEADAAKLDLAAVLLLAPEQRDWEADAIAHKRGTVMHFPIGMKDLMHNIRKLMPAAAK